MQSDSEAPTVASPPRSGSERARQESAGGATHSSGRGRFLPGTLLADRYRIVAPLGRGGMGEVYRADDLKLGQTVALKFLPHSLEGDASRLGQLMSEVRLARQIAHPNVCRVYDAGEAEGHPFLTMEFVDGEDLAALLRRIGHVPKDKAIQIARQLCSGLAAAHELGILHRDLKPANVMIDGRGRARITDFGLAVADGGPGSRDVVGTPAYMAPEQREGREVTVRSDLYSLGLVLYELFTGRPAFQAANLAELSRLQSRSSMADPSSLVEGFDPAVERAILRCLDPDPKRRPSSALQLSAALPGGDPLAAALAAGETPSPEMVAEAEIAQAMPPGRALAIAALAFALAAGSAWWASGMRLGAFVPLEKPPAAMVDRGEQVIAALGYTEPIYARPVDRACGYTTWTNRIREIEKSDRSPTRWNRLRDPAANVLSFWYRQSPQVMVPDLPGRLDLRGIDRWNPFPQTPGEMLVVMGLDGRLETFAFTPPRYAPDTLHHVPPDWGPTFALAQLDTARFRPVESRFQRFMAPDVRAAWIGTRAESPRDTLRVEAGSYRGRVALFAILRPADIATLAHPDLSRGSRWGVVGQLVLLALCLFAAKVARGNLRRGQADSHGATRVATAIFIGYLAALELQSHALVQPEGAGQMVLLLCISLFVAVIAWAAYLALEPFVRRVWPSMLMSWSRMVSGARLRFQDPLVGRSVLAGIYAGGLVMIFGEALPSLLQSAIEGAPARPLAQSFSSLLGTQRVLSDLIGAAAEGAFQAVQIMGLLAAMRAITRRESLAIVLTLGTLFFFYTSPPTQPTPAGLAAWAAAGLAMSLIGIGVLLRFGLLALVVAITTTRLLDVGPVSSLSEWYSQPGVIALGMVAVLALWGYRAASAGRPSPLGESS
jgi:serine/threonine-protein kinase